jgi:hypothetical protein
MFKMTREEEKEKFKEAYYRKQTDWLNKSMEHKMTTCLVCGDSFGNIQLHEHWLEHKRILEAGKKVENERKNKEHKMTREEAFVIAKDKLGSPKAANDMIDFLELMNLVKFEKKQAPYTIIELAKNGDIINNLYGKGYLLNKYGSIRFEEWPEGLVLWVGGDIVWKSWEKYYKKGDRVNLYDNFDGIISGMIKE